MTTLFLAWQDPISRRWFTVGRLDVRPGLYSFAYTNGALNAKDKAGFEPLAAFPELARDYTSEKIFPLFSNRFLPTHRAEYSDYLKWLNISEDEKDPVAVLARSGGRRATDTLEVFPMPIRNKSGAFEFHFMVHGLRHMTREAVARVFTLECGERLLVMRDVQNPRDPRAIALRTAETVENDMYIVGYLPRYLCDDYFQPAEEGSYPTITVERVNPPPAPVQFRLLCKAIVNSRTEVELCANGEYQRISSASPLRDEATAGIV